MIVQPPSNLDSEQKFEWLVQRHQMLTAPIEEYFADREDWKLKLAAMRKQLHDSSQTSLVVAGPAIDTTWKPKNSYGEFGPPSYHPNHPAPKTQPQQKPQPKNQGKAVRASRGLTQRIPALQLPQGRLTAAMGLFLFLMFLVVILVKVKTQNGATLTRWQLMGQVLQGKAGIA